MWGKALLIVHNQKVKTPDKYEFKTNMESMIHYFKWVTEG